MWHLWLFYRWYYQLNTSQKDTLHTWKTIWLFQMWQRVQNFLSFIFINIIRPPAKTKWKCFNALFVENVFRKKKNHRQHNDNIHQDIKRFSCQPCGQLFRKKWTLSFHIEIKHPDPNMSFPEWSFEICKEPYPHKEP